MRTGIYKYMLIDGNALIHRGFHAVPPLSTKAGEQTNAVYGFCMILLRAIKELKPTHIACTFDLAGPTFRHEKYQDYKATRIKAAQELYDQIPRVKEVVRALNIPIFECQGFEADDCLGTLAREICELNNHDCHVMIVTGDLDTLQLVNKCVSIYTLRKGINDTAIYDEKAVRLRFGLNPSQMIDYKALRGDPSDNIKGVSGIGEKGAAELIKNFGSLGELYSQIKNHVQNVSKKIKPRTLKLLIEQEDQARQSYELSTIITNVPIHTNIPVFVFDSQALQKVTQLFKELEFYSLIDKLPKNYSGIAESTKNIEAKNFLSKPSEAEEKPKQTFEKISQNYVLVNSQVQLDEFLQELRKASEFALDTETTSLDAIVARVVGASFAFLNNNAYFVAIKYIRDNPEIQTILNSPKQKKIGHNIKYDLLSLENEGISVSGIYFDTMIASYLLNAGTRQHNLDNLAFNELGYQMQAHPPIPPPDKGGNGGVGKGKNQITMDKVSLEKVSWYACEDAHITWQLKTVFQKRLKEEGLEKIFYEIEMPLLAVLANMERAGIKLDIALLEILSNEAKKQIGVLEKNIYKLAGEKFNINSPKQLKEILFNVLRLEPVENRKTKTGLSTAAGELEKMLGQHPILEKIISYRELTKLQSTYLVALPELVNKATGRLHTSYNQTIAATGRLSSTDPNLQNIPIRGEGLGAQARKAFVAQEGWELLSLDYSQIELRIIAHLSQDKNMKEIFERDEDIHTNTAMAVFGVSAGKVTAEMRRDAKTINFGILYGLSSFGLSSQISSVARHEAKEFIDQYFAAYPGVKNYIEQVKESVRKDGYVRNELGRMRKFPEIKSSQFFIRAAAERQAVNFPIQSLAADVIKVAMINVYKEIKEKKLEINMLLQVHDELVFEVKEDKVKHYVKIIKPIMEQAIKLSVPVRVDAKFGKNWGEMEKIN